MRQLEGKIAAGGAAGQGLKAVPMAYNPQAQGGAAALTTTAKTYNPAADVASNGDAKPKKKVSPLLPSHF